MEKLSPKEHSIIVKLNNFFKKNNIKVTLERNNFEITEQIDSDLLKNKLENTLEKLDFNELKIDEITFFNKTTIIIAVKNEWKEEYVKIFYNKWIQYYKNQLTKLFSAK